MTRNPTTTSTAFRHDATGTVSLIFAALAVLLFSFIGAAVDYGRWSNASSRTVDALDAALLTAGRTLQTSQSQEEAITAAEQMFLEHAKSRLDLKNPKIEVALADNGTALEGTVSGRIVTPFMGLMNFDSLAVHAKSKVGFSVGAGSSKGGSDLEISLMLDVTGSMCDDKSGPCTGGARMDAMKAAASDLVNIIMKGSAVSSSARIALVPFSNRVRLGPSQTPSVEATMKKVTGLDHKWTGWFQNCTASTYVPGATSEQPGSWTCTSYAVNHAVNWALIPCVTDRTGPAEATDAAPGANTWSNANDGGRAPESWDSSDTPLTSDTGQTPGDPASHWNYDSTGKCWDTEEEDILMPLTNDKSALLDRINSLKAYGATAGALGTAWTWYTLSPNWSGVWPSASTPGSYSDLVASGSNPPKLRKIAVLMTDGLYNTTRSWIFDPADAGHADEIAEIGTRAKQMCTNMKAQGIEIYTVGFDLDSLPPADKARAVDVLQTCGTDISHFYDALDAEQLKQSFRDIAMQLSQLYVAK